jgi:hypothetical protein
MVRAKAMYRARWYPREQARTNLDKAGEIADGLGVKAPFRARLINAQLYFPIRDWLEGRAFPTNEVPRLQRWAKELRDLLDQNWAKQQTYDWDDPLDQNFLIPAAWDTLGMSELAIGITTKNLSKQQCAQAAVDLIKSHEFFDRLFKKYPQEYQDVLKISEAHRELRDQVCTQ